MAVIVFGAPAPLPLAALAGALVSGALLYALAWRRGVSGHRFVLVGIGMAALAQAGVGYVLTEGRIFEVSEAYVWLVGSVNGRGWEHVWPLAAALLLLPPRWSRSRGGRTCSSSATTSRAGSACTRSARGWRCWPPPSS